MEKIDICLTSGLTWQHTPDFNVDPGACQGNDDALRSSFCPCPSPVEHYRIGLAILNDALSGGFVCLPYHKLALAIFDSQKRDIYFRFLSLATEVTAGLFGGNSLYMTV